MNLAAFSEAFFALRFPRLGENAPPERDSVLQLRSIVQNAFADGELLVDCIAHELPLVERSWPRPGLVPFFVDREFGVSFAFAFWGPGDTTRPHEHGAWSVSSVCHNRLDVATYDRAESYRRKELVAKNLFHAELGQVGYMYGPAIHSPKNVTTEGSVSLHISSPLDGEIGDDVEPIRGLVRIARFSTQLQDAPHPVVWAAGARARRQEADLLASMLLSSRSPRARELLGTCARLTSSRMRELLRSVVPKAVAVEDSFARLVRVHRDLRYSVEREAAECVVFVDAPEGPREALRVNALAHEALAFTSSKMAFEVRELPGGLDGEERVAIADALEDLGLFRRSRHDCQ